MGFFGKVYSIPVTIIPVSGTSQKQTLKYKEGETFEAALKRSGIGFADSKLCLNEKEVNIHAVVSSLIKLEVTEKSTSVAKTCLTITKKACGS